MMEEPYTTGGFICVTDIEGCRHALRLTSITSVRDAGDDRMESLIVLNGGRATLMVPVSMETLLAEILDATCSASRWGGGR